uniref:Uncharacterized protein n=1 Tax=Helianthus annuus TaxID=4232 RepID=A0A251TRN8_HELAN
MHAKNDCMIYWREYEHVKVGHICHTTKWEPLNDKQGGKGKHDVHYSKVPAKVVWHFPLKPRLQKLFMCSETVKYMTWHDSGRPKDGYI